LALAARAVALLPRRERGTPDAEMRFLVRRKMGHLIFHKASRKFCFCAFIADRVCVQLLLFLRVGFPQ
jgi:hypothetical protein